MEIYVSTFCKEVIEPIIMGGLSKGPSIQLQKKFSNRCRKYMGKYMLGH